MGGEPAVGEEDGRGGVDGEEERSEEVSTGEIRLRGRRAKEIRRGVVDAVSRANALTCSRPD